MKTRVGRLLSAHLLGLVIFASLCTNGYAARGGEEIAGSIKIDPKERLSRQWEYVYKRERLLKKYGIFALPKEEQDVLKKWLMANAKDSNRARKAGKF